MNKIPSNEIARKVLHIGSSVIPLSYLWFIQDREIMVLLLGLLSLSAVCIEFSRGKVKFVDALFSSWLGIMLRDSETCGKFNGATWVLFGGTITVFLFAMPVAVPALLFLTVGDTFAAIGGKLYPVGKIGDKTLSGTAAGITTSFGAAYLVNQTLPLEVIFLGAVAAMGVELLPIPLNDNLTIPVCSGTVMLASQGLI
ncbi:MAG: hypothetical protein VX957_05575 [Candidatus Neomarinimicrobiota bacterium]|nr:hypothetical protein [Candidatus Neomarinimicrobiota bacterium]HJM10156.1 hypothetical protein [Candidatus Neomarinimicrobiota bacterium]